MMQQLECEFKNVQHGKALKLSCGHRLGFFRSFFAGCGEFAR